MATAASRSRLAAWQRQPPALQALGIQVLCWLPITAVLPVSHVAAPLLQGGLAFLLSRGLRLPVWWQAINLVFFPLAGLVARLELAPSTFLVAFLLLAISLPGSLVSRVPLFLSGRHAIDGLLAALPSRPGLRVIDLGSGLGGVLDALHARRPDLHLSGVEVAPLTWLLSRLRLGQAASIRLGSLWNVDLGAYDVVYAYLSPAAMEALWAKVEREMRPGSLFISNSFAVPGHAPDHVLEVGARRTVRLMLWQR